MFHLQESIPESPVMTHFYPELAVVDGILTSRWGSSGSSSSGSSSLTHGCRKFFTSSGSTGPWTWCFQVTLVAPPDRTRSGPADPLLPPGEARQQGTEAVRRAVRCGLSGAGGERRA